MSEIDVCLTDYFLTLLCLYCFVVIRRGAFRSVRFLRYWSVFFVSLSLASLFGGTVHGFFPDPMGIGHQILWPLTLLSIGATTYAVWMIGAVLIAPPRHLKFWKYFAIVNFSAYAAAVIFVTRQFGIAIAHYAPAMIFLLGVGSARWRRTKGFAEGRLVSGVLLTILAALIQQQRIAIHPHFFDHNSLYHVVQAGGIWLFFASARALGSAITTDESTPGNG